MRNKTIQLLLLLPLLTLSLTVAAQNGSAKQKYWIFLKDKGISLKQSPQQILSPQALARRARQGITVDYRDYPLDPAYLRQIQDAGFQIENRSRWFNAVTVRASRNEIAQLRALPVVRKVTPVNQFKVEKPNLEPEPVLKTDYDAGYTDRQLNMVDLDVLHKYGYTGKGMTICVLDNGFRNVNVNACFQHLRDENRILATYDFVHHEVDVYNGGNHGAFVLSILSGFIPHNYTGAAPGANFILFQTEDDNFEGHIEEDNWVAGAELADSLGADVLSTSLGYSTGIQDTIYLPNGDTIVDWEFKHLDGNTTIITRGADLAASRGMLVVNSAGNNGFNHINAPADGDSVLAVGAVDSLEVIAGFSSRGPTFDGRIKPDLSAMGALDYYISTTGNISKGSGTSFSCPIMAGLAACLWQSDPTVKSMELFQYMKESADRFENPDNDYGWGIPKGIKAFKLMNGVELDEEVIVDLTINEGMAAFPNPFSEYFDLLIDSEDTLYQVEVELTAVDPAGRQTYKFHQTINVRPLVNRYRFTREEYFPGFPNGIYTLTIRREGEKKGFFTRKMVLDK
ncbi:MAG: S8 family serine peptidase [Bacteroidia bacterium]|nr:S8 family serine peptidase [Bacteroidia bacterium]